MPECCPDRKGHAQDLRNWDDAAYRKYLRMLEIPGENGLRISPGA